MQISVLKPSSNYFSEGILREKFMIIDLDMLKEFKYFKTCNNYLKVIRRYNKIYFEPSKKN